MINFKVAHFRKDAILYAVFFYVRYVISYRDLEAIMQERGVKVDYSTLYRWVINFSSFLALVTKKINVLLLLRGGHYLHGFMNERIYLCLRKTSIRRC